MKVNSASHEGLKMLDDTRVKNAYIPCRKAAETQNDEADYIAGSF